MCMLPVNVFAATQISGSDIQVNAHKVGEKTIEFASLYNQSLEAVKTEWTGTLDGNGCFMANTAYTVNVTVRIKAGQDKYLVNKEGGFRINRKKAVMTSLSEDKQQAVISYTFDNGASSAPVQGTKPATVVTTDRSDVFNISGVKWTGDLIPMVALLQRIHTDFTLILQLRTE